MAEPHEKLATALSTAVRIEPELIRAVRLAVFPGFDVSAEADLWFSPVVSSRGPHGIVFDEDALVGLRASLTSWLRSAPASDPVHRLGDVLASVHKRLSPALALEERVTWLAVNGRDDAIDAELLPALKALVQENRSGVADWFTAAWHRLPANARASLTAWKLAQVARPDLNGATTPLSLLRTPESTPDLSDIVDVLPDARVLLRRKGNTLEVGDFEPDLDTVGIMVPDTDPRLVEVGLRKVAVQRGASTSVDVAPGAVRVKTARGSVYEVAAGSPVAGQFIAVEVVPGIKQMTIVDGFAPLDDVLGDDYTLTTVQGRSERDAAQHLELWLRLNQRTNAPLVVYLRAWGALDDEILRVCADSGSAQIIVLVDRALVRLDRTFDEPRVWIALVSAPGDESPPARLARLLTSGPSAAEARQRWSTGGQYLTGQDICAEFLRHVEVLHQAPGPMFRNPLYGRPDEIPQWFGHGSEVAEVVRWLRTGGPGVYVITGSPGSGKSSLLNRVGREEPLVRISNLIEFDHVVDSKDLPRAVAIDGLDSADTQWPAEIRELTARGGRAVVTMRGDAPWLQRLAPRGADMDLDDMRSHVVRRISGVDPDMDADTIASFLVDTLELTPQLTRRVAFALQQTPVSTHTSGWRRRVLDTLHAAFEEDLRDSRMARLLLTVLAWSHGSGMPLVEWRACATAVNDLTGDRLTEHFLLGNFATSLIVDLGHYVTSNVRGYRLTHPRLVTYLREQSAPELPGQIADALVRMAWRDRTPSPYLRGSLRHHVIDSGGSALPRFREVAQQDPSWLSELGAAASSLATTTTGEHRVECADTAVQAYLELVRTERRHGRALRSALDQLAASLRAAGDTRRAEQVWPDAMRQLPESLARWVQETRKPEQPPAPPRTMRSYDMVVVVPGVTDNILRTPDGARIALAPLPPDIGDDHPDDGILAGELDRAGYIKLLDALGAHGYTQTTGNLMLLPYDWRLSNRWTGRWIGEQVEPALAAWRDKNNPDAKVVFVCVSTGGLPTRWYVERCGGAEITAGMITIGTPYRGTMYDLEKLVDGTADPHLTDVWRSLPSEYQTLPIYNCIEHRGNRVPLHEVDVPVLDRHRVEDGIAFLTDLLDAESSRPHALANTYSIIGAGHETPVTARIQRRKLIVSPQLGDNLWQGDSYVPTFSASHPALASTRTFEVQERHDRLHSNDEVLRELTRILPRATGKQGTPSSDTTSTLQLPPPT